MFKGKVVWITGASSGIGLTFAKALHAQGAQLVLSALSAEDLEPVAQLFPAAYLSAFDMTDFGLLPARVQDVIQRFGRIDVLINNAGVTQRATAAETDFSVCRRVIDVDLMGPIALTKLVMPYLVKQRSGRVIAVSSIAGKVGVPLRTSYCAAKHGVFGYFDALRTEVAHLGVEIHVIGPGAVRTNIARNALTGQGTPFGKTDAFIEAGFDPDLLVERALHQITAGKREIMIPRGMERRLYLARRFAPEVSFRKLLQVSPGFMERFENPP